jgi:hypothetical protein
MTELPEALRQSRALWNRTHLDLRSDEVLAQILDRGEMKAWRALFQLAKEDPALRSRIAHLARTVPLPLARFWLAALKSLGEDVDLAATLPAVRPDGGT